MPGYTLNFEVSGGNICSTERNITADSVEFVTAAFSFDDSWEALLKTAVFRVGEVVYHTPIEDDVCTVPFEALQDGVIFISVFGVLGNTRATTNECALTVQKSGYVAVIPSAPSPDPYNYFLEKVTELKNTAVDSATESRAFAESAASSAENANLDQNRAASSARVAGENSLRAIDSADLAVASREVAEQAAKTATESAKSAEIYAKAALESSEDAQNTVMEQIEVHNSSQNDLAHPNLLELASQAKSIALGKADSLVFDTEAQLVDWVSGVYVRSDGKTTDDLKVGDNLYVIEVSVPDYWWDGEKIQTLGAEQPNLTDYYTKNQIDSRLKDASFDIMSREEYDEAYLSGSLDAGRIYFVYEEETQ